MTSVNRITHPFYISLSKADKAKFRTELSRLKQQSPEIERDEAIEILVQSWLSPEVMKASNSDADNVISLPTFQRTKNCNKTVTRDVTETATTNCNKLQHTHNKACSPHSETVQPSQVQQNVQRTPSLSWFVLADIIACPKKSLLSIFVISLGALLVKLQADVYQAEGVTSGLIISLACEISLVVLAFISPKDRLIRLARNFGFVIVFGYALGSQSFGLVSGAEREKTALIDSSSDKIRIESELSAAISAKTNASKYGDHIGVAREAATIAGLKAQLSKLKQGSSKQAELVDYQAFGLIALRAFLMLVMLVTVHELRESLVPQGG